MTDLQVGYKPSGWAQGVGVVDSGNARVTYLGTFSQGVWIKEAGIRCGWRTGSGAGVQAEFFTGSTQPAALVWKAATPRTGLARMLDDDRTTGRNESWAVTGLYVAANTKIYGGARANAGGLSFGQDNSGERMYYDTAQSSGQVAYDVDSSSPQGKINAWLIGRVNTKPNQPGIRTAGGGVGAGAVTSDPTPYLEITFSDPDEDLGDYVTSVLIEVWNSAKSSRLQNSGWMATSTTDRTNHYKGWAVGSGLAAGTYYARGYTRDRAGLQSVAREWAFTVNAGGVVTGVDVAPGVELGTKSGNVLVLPSSGTTPTVYATWTHSGGAEVDTWYWRLLNASGATVRATRNYSPGAGVDLPGDQRALVWSTGVWAALTPGATRYRFEIWAVDEFGSESAHTYSPYFEVNAVPVSTASAPANGLTVSTYPRLSGTSVDANDDAAAKAASGGSVGFQVRKVISGQGAEDDWVYIPSARRATSGGVQYATPNATEMPTYGQYQWRYRVADPWGELAAWSTVRSFTYTSPPVITITAPADEAEVATGAPVITATVDRTISQYEVTVTPVGQADEVWSSDVHTGAGTTLGYAVTPGVLAQNIRYDLAVWVKTTDGLEATAHSQFTIVYPQPWYLSGVRWVRAMSSATDSAQPEWSEHRPNLVGSWDRLDEDQVSDDEFDGYLLYRTGGERTRLIRIMDRDQTTYTDVTADPGVTVTWYVGYLQRKNDGVDVLTSRMVAWSTATDVRFSVLTDEATGESVTIHFWESRPFHLNLDRAVMPILGQRLPDIYGGPASYGDIQFEGRVLDDRSGRAEYTALDIARAVERFARTVVTVDDTGRARSALRPLWLRTATRTLPVQITDFSEDPQHEPGRAAFSFTVTERNDDREASFVIDADAVRDMTNAVEPSMLLPLAGGVATTVERRGGLDAAVGTGALPMTTGALGEAAAINYVTNPSLANSIAGWSGPDIAWDSTQGYLGARSLRFAASGVSAFGLADVATYMPVAPGEWATVSFWAKGSGSFRIQIAEYDGADAAISNAPSGFQSAVLTLTDDWVRYSYSRRITSTTARKARLRVESTDVLSGNYDLFMLTKTPGPIDYFQGGFSLSGDPDATGWLGTAHASWSYRLGWALGGAVELLETTTNDFPNPRAVGGPPNGWGKTSTYTLAQDTGVTRDFVPSARVGLTGTGFVYVSPAPVGTYVPGDPVSVSGYLMSSVAGRAFLPRLWASNGVGYVSSGETVVTCAVAGEWYPFSVSVASLPDGVETGALTCYIYPQTGVLSGDVLWVVEPQLEKNAYPTPFVARNRSDGTTVTGVTWAGTVDNSASSRAAGWLNLDGVDGGPTPRTGALAMRLRRRVLNRNGPNGYLWYRGGTSAGTKQFALLYLNSTGTTVTFYTRYSTGTVRAVTASLAGIAADAWFTVQAEWTEGTVRIRVNGGSWVAASRGGDPVDDTWGATTHRVGYPHSQRADIELDGAVWFDGPRTLAQYDLLMALPAWAWDSVKETP